jgi:RNA polymerase sigma-70 factor (ECF subfamily)
LDIAQSSYLNTSIRRVHDEMNEGMALMRTGARAPAIHAQASHLLFEREVGCCRRQLFPVALQMTGNASDAEDLIQETMTRAYTGLRSFTPGSNARAWLHRIMTNSFLNDCRKRRREPVHVLSPELETAHPVTAIGAIGGGLANAPSAEDEALRQFAYSEFREALDALPECFKATIYLADVEGYSNYDVAEMIGVPIGTVMSRLHRARNRLRRDLSAHVPTRDCNGIGGNIQRVRRIPREDTRRSVAGMVRPQAQHRR